jgi:ABC-type antimicrobial peptide transport system permease subunit
VEYYFEDKYYTSWNETFDLILQLANQTLFVATNISMSMNDTALLAAIQNDTTNILNHWGGVYAIDIKTALDNILLEVRPIRQLASNPPVSSELKIALDNTQSYAVSSLQAQKQAIVTAKQTQQQNLWVYFIIAIVGLLLFVNFVVKSFAKPKKAEET